MEGVDPHLVQAVRAGTYLVDPHAVAEAIIRRERRRLGDVLEALEMNGAPGVVEDDEPTSRTDAA
jgi:hypothetical protein